MDLTSSFAAGASIDTRHTEDGQNLSPPLDWSEAPDGTRTFAILCDDPDAPSPRRPAAEPWVHWVIYNIPAEVSRLPAGVSATAEPPQVVGARQGTNSWPRDNVGYRGPAPPPGSGRHRYFFKIYALDCELNLPPGVADKRAVLAAMEGHVLSEGSLHGTYER